MDDILEYMLSEPTAPFHEGRVFAAALALARQAGVPCFFDSAGNLVLGAASAARVQAMARARGPEPLRVYFAHADHPGFTVESTGPKGLLRLRFLGGVPRKRVAGAPLYLADGEGVVGLAELESAELVEAQGGRLMGRARLAGRVRPERLAHAFGGYWPGWHWERRGAWWLAKACDDLVGASVLVALCRRRLGDLQGRPGFRTPMIAVLTRAEEVGLVGAVRHLQLGWYRHARRPVLAVSLETSPIRPGVEFGKGPILRVGDWRTTFDPAALLAFRDLALKAGVPHQVRHMDGGSCEGGACMAFGLPTVGVCVALGNYHNHPLNVLPDGRPAGHAGMAPEFVHGADVQGMFALCDLLAEPGLDWSGAMEGRRRALANQAARWPRLPGHA